MRANWSAETEATLDTSTGDDVATTTRHLKRQKANTTAFFGDSDESEEVEEQEAIKDELMDYLALPQIKYKTEWDALDCVQTVGKSTRRSSQM